MTTKNKPLRLLGWLAVSSEPQASEEKDSLPAQERSFQAFAESQRAHVVETLIVPGFSRRYKSWELFAHEALARESITAGVRMLEHWQRQTFDVVWLRDASRFGRSQSLVSRFVEETIDSGALIYSERDGWVDEKNYRMFISMAGYSAAMEIDKLVAGRKLGIAKRMQRGLSITSRIPMSHRRVRDETTGREIRLELDDSKALLWQRVAELLLEGVSYGKLEEELYQRYGEVNPTTGRKYYPNQIYHVLMKPIFWGHLALHHHSPDVPNGYRYGAWIYDENAPLPEGVTIERGKVPAVYTGELAEKIKAEIRRRSQTIQGSAKPRYTHRFSGLCVCAGCGRFMATHVDSKSSYRGLVCAGTKGVAKRLIFGPCNNYKICNEKKLVRWFTAAIERMLAAGDVNILAYDDAPVEDTPMQLEAVTREIAALNTQIRTLIREQSLAPEAAQTFYREEVARLNDLLGIKEELRRRLEHQQVEKQQTMHIQTQALNDIAAMSLEIFWQQESRVINQILHRLMGKYRLIIDEGEVAAAKIVNRPQRRRL